MGKRKCGCVYADAKNSQGVRSGHELGGYLKSRCLKHQREFEDQAPAISPHNPNEGSLMTHEEAKLAVLASRLDRFGIPYAEALEDEDVEAIIARYLEARGSAVAVPIDDLLFAYRGLLVLKTVLRKAKLEAGVSATDEILQRLQAIAPVLVPMSSFRVGPLSDNPKGEQDNG